MHSLRFKIATTDNDIERLRPLSVEFHQRSHFSGIEYDHEKRDRVLSRALTSNSSRIFIAENDGEYVGFLFCSAAEYIVGKETLIVTVHSFYVKESIGRSLLGGRIALRLLRLAINWTKELGAREVMVHVTSGIDLARADRLFRKLNFKVLGANYALAVE